MTIQEQPENMFFHQFRIWKIGITSHPKSMIIDNTFIPYDVITYITWIHDIYTEVYIYIYIHKLTTYSGFGTMSIYHFQLKPAWSCTAKPLTVLHRWVWHQSFPPTSTWNSHSLGRSPEKSIKNHSCRWMSCYDLGSTVWPRMRIVKNGGV